MDPVGVFRESVVLLFYGEYIGRGGACPRTSADYLWPPLTITRGSSKSVAPVDRFLAFIRVI